MPAQPAAQRPDYDTAPEKLIDLTQDEIFSIPLGQQQQIQLAGIRRRFGELMERIPMLTRLAQEQGVGEVRRIEDLAPLLVPHSAMKSYPLSFLENSRFDRLTQWLDGFTTHDLSHVDASGCDSIDDWLMLIDRETPVRPMHSTGTSGKLSFLPRSTVEMPAMVAGYYRQFDPFRDEPSLLGAPVASAPIIYLQYRTGGMAQHRHIEWLQKDVFGGDANMIVTLYPGRFSADAASIGGRLRVAEARGELGRIKISPKLIERRDAFIKEQEQSGRHLEAFFASIARFKGRTVSVMGHTPMLFNLAVEAEKRGIDNLFASNSFVAAGGGTKGHKLPDDWMPRVQRALGGARLVEGYGMTEVVAVTRTCSAGHYHLPAWHVPFLLDPGSGEPKPRSGTQTGRYGTFDLCAQTYWGGFLTGDEVTLNFGDREPCSCGRIGPFVHRGIRRFTEKEGGDDKITCAGAPEAHDKAIEFILQSIG